MKGRTLYVNNEAHSPPLKSPKIINLFLEPQEQAKLDKLKFQISNAMPEAGSEFSTMACTAKIHWRCQ